MIRGVIFDCFGVIISDALQVLGDRYAGHDPAKVSRLNDIMTAANRGFMDRDDMYRQMADVCGLSEADVRAQTARGEVKNSQVMNFILDLRRAGYKTALLSNVSSGGLDQRFTATELAGHFDTVVASGAIGYAKPEARAYEITAQRLGLRLDECLMVDDREVCVAGARTVGMQAIRYQAFGQFRTDCGHYIDNI